MLHSLLIGLVLSWDYAIKVIPTASILTVDYPRLWQRWSCTPLFLSLSLSSPAGAFHILHRHPSTLNCNVTPSFRPSTVCLIWTPSKTTHAAVFCLSCIHLIHMLCIIALDGLETCGTHFISVLLFGFLFSSVFVICITLFCFSVIVLRMAMVPDCLAYWTTLKRCISWSENTQPLYAVQHIQMWINIYNL